MTRPCPLSLSLLLWLLACLFQKGATNIVLAIANNKDAATSSATTQVEDEGDKSSNNVRLCPIRELYEGLGLNFLDTEHFLLFHTLSPLTRFGHQRGNPAYTWLLY